MHMPPFYADNNIPECIQLLLLYSSYVLAVLSVLLILYLMLFNCFTLFINCEDFYF